MPGNLPATLTTLGAPAFVGRVQPEFAVKAWARLDFAPRRDDEAGLVVRANEGNHYALAVRARPSGGGRVARLVRRLKEKTVVVSERKLPDGMLTLEIAATRAAYKFYVTVGNGRAARAPADFDWFELTTNR